MQKNYSKTPKTVKPKNAAWQRRYPLLCGFKNILLNALPFILIWLVMGWSTLVAALTAFILMLIYFMRENYLNNRRLSEMARKIKEQGNV